MLKRFINYIDVEIWKIKTEELKKYEAWGIHVLRILILTIRDFTKDNCAYRASALTYFTLLTIVPVLGMAFGIAKAFGLDSLLEEQIRLNFQGQEAIMDNILSISNNLLDNTREEIVAGIGLLILLWSVIRILINIENTLNAIWNVKKARTIIQKLVDYSAFILIAPTLAAASSGLTVYISSIVRQYTENSEIIGSFTPIINMPLKILPYAIIWILLTFIYLVMPNKKVDLKAALIGGVLAGTAYQLTQWGYIKFQVSATNINAIYGSFAAVPLFLIWLQLSWCIVLFGAELSYAIQNVHLFEQKKGVSTISNYYKRMLTVTVAHIIIKRFQEEKPPITSAEIGDELEIPLKLLHSIIEELKVAEIISTTIRDKEVTYQPARDISKLTIHHIFELIDKRGANKLDLAEYPALDTIAEAFEELKKNEENSKGNLLLKGV
ncbi:MAG: YihY/virulence factor BrkB family protein [Saprospiraceae bacterium]